MRGWRNGNTEERNNGNRTKTARQIASQEKNPVVRYERTQLLSSMFGPEKYPQTAYSGTHRLGTDMLRASMVPRIVQKQKQMLRNELFRNYTHIECL